MLALIASAWGAPVLAPMQEIAPYEQIREDQLTWVELPAALEHPGQLRELADAVGRYATEPLFPGEPLRAERLSSGARATLLGPDEDLLQLSTGPGQVWSPGRVDLVVVTPEGSCFLAQDLRSHGSPEPGVLALTGPAADVAVWRWAVTKSPVVALARNPTDRGRVDGECALGLRPQIVEIPTGGSALVTFDAPISDLVASHPDRASFDLVAERTALWLHSESAVGRHAITVRTRPEHAPFILDLRPAAPSPATQSVAVGGWLPLGANTTSVHTHAAGHAFTVNAGGQAYLVANQPGLVDVLRATADGAWHTARVEVREPRADGRDLRLGRRHRVVVPPDAMVLSSDPAVLQAETLPSGKTWVRAVGVGQASLLVVEPDGRHSALALDVVARGEP